MSQISALSDMFKANGNRLTLMQILHEWPKIGSKYTNRISELREDLKGKGFTIVWHKKEIPIESWYSIEPIEVESFIDPKTHQREWSQLWQG